MSEYGLINSLNQVVQTADPLPDTWVTPSGATILGLSKLPDAALAALGWLPVTRQPFDPAVDASTLPVISAKAIVFQAIPKDMSILQAQLIAQVNATAGDARHKQLPSKLLDQEYSFALAQAQAWTSANYANPVPAVIQVSATAAGITPQAEAANIINTGAALLGVLVQIRQLRLNAKQAIIACTDGPTAVTIANTAIAALQAIAQVPAE